jgi:hypothetical protein
MSATNVNCNHYSPGFVLHDGVCPQCGAEVLEYHFKKNDRPPSWVAEGDVQFGTDVLVIRSGGSVKVYPERQLPQHECILQVNSGQPKWQENLHVWTRPKA